MYKVKTRTERRLREVHTEPTTTSTADGVKARYLVEEEVCIAELFEDDVFECSGEGTTERDAYAALGRELDAAYEMLRETHAERVDALHLAVYGVPR